MRLELAVNFDEFEPTDLGRCGEPYAPLARLRACRPASSAHGYLGVGLAGEERPPDPWDEPTGIEVGARIEFRWDRFSFAITDFYGYDDFAVRSSSSTLRAERRPGHGPAARHVRAAAATPEHGARPSSTGNRQLFEMLACDASLGFGIAAAALDRRRWA